MHHRIRWAAYVLTVLAVGGCATTQATTTSEEPAKVESVPGAQVSKLTLTADAVARLGIRTVPAGPTIPLSAVLYDKDGRTWAYTSPERDTFIRQEVTIAKVSGDVVTVQTGPSAGTEVVTVGAAELLGTEYGVDGG
jgi:hypothetical protein